MRTEDGEVISKTGEAHEKAADEPKKLYHIRKGYQKDLILIAHTSHT